MPPLLGLPESATICDSDKYLMQKGYGSVNKTKDVDFDYQAYMKDYAPDPDKIHRGPEARQKRREAAIHNHRGIAYRNEGNYDLAIESFTKAIELNPDFAKAYTNRAVTYQCKGLFDRAIADHTRAIELKSDLAEIYNNRGAAYGEQGDYDRAIADHTRAIELNPNLAEAYNNRGVAHYKKSDYNHAIEDCTQAIQLKPSFIDKVYCNRAKARLHLQEWESAKLDLTVAVAMGINIIREFNKDYASVLDYEQRNKVKLPADLAEMLTSQGGTIGEETEREATHESAGNFEIVLDEIVRKYDRAWKTLAKP